MLDNYNRAKHILLNGGRADRPELVAAKVIVEYSEHYSWEGYATPHPEDLELVKLAFERITDGE